MQRDHQQLQHADREHEALRRAHALHQRDRIEMTRHVASRRDRHGDRGEQDRDQRREIEEAAGAIDRRANLRTGVGESTMRSPGFLRAVSCCLNSATAGASPANKRGVAKCGCLPAIEPGRRHIFEAHQQRRREIDELRALVGPIVEHLRRSSARSSRRECGRRPCAPSCAEQPRFEPRFAAARHRSRLRAPDRTARRQPSGGRAADSARTRRESR